MSDHILDVTKMIQDTPRMHSALMDAPDAGFANIWKVGCDIERELNAANAIIRQQQLLDEENFRLQDRIKQLEVVERLATAQMDYIQQLEEQLMDAKNKHAALVADVVLYEDRGERIKRLEEALDTLTLVVGLTPIRGNLAALQEAMDQSRAVLKAKEVKP